MSFIFKITTTTSPQTFIIPCVNDGTFNATVNYGDGTGSQTVTAYNDSNLTHSFATAGQHTITIDGTFPNVKFYDNTASRVLVDEVVDLGDVGWVYLGYAFRDCSNLTAFNVGTADTSSVTTMAFMFRDCSSLTSLDLSGFDTSSVTSTIQIVFNCSSLTSLNVSSFDTSSVTTMQQMFQNCTNLTTLDVSNFNTSNVTTMYAMFFNCNKLTTLNLSSFNTSNVTNMQEMLNGCTSLTALDVTSFDTSSVTSMASVFFNCDKLTTLDLSSFDTSSVISMTNVFRGCTSLTTLNVSSFDTSSVTNMSQMFRSCSSLSSLDLSNFNTPSVTNMSLMFYNCLSLTSLNVSSFDTSSVTTMGYMFQDCSSLASLDVSGFDTSSVTDMGLMFYNCLSLTSLYLSSFDTSSVNNMGLMFYNCSSLTNLDIKNFNVSSVTNGINFLRDSNNALTTTAYDELLEAWAAQDVQPNVPWHFGDAQYTVETIADWYSPRSNSSLSIINNKLVSIADSTATFGAAQQIDNLIVGNAYKIAGTATCSNSSASVYFRVSTNSALTANILTISAVGTVEADVFFIATATTHYVGTIVTGHAANDTVTIDAGITVKEITNYTEANAASEIEYSQENVFGSEEVVNGDFASYSNWTVTATGTESATIANNILTFDRPSDGVDPKITNTGSVVAGKNYLVEFKVLSATKLGNNVAVRFGTQTTYLSDQGQSLSPFGLKRLYITANQNGLISLLHGGAGPSTITLSEFTVKEITNAVEYKNIPQSARELYTLKDDTWVGSNELVVNGDFATDLSGWSVTNPTGVTVEWTSNGMRILTDGTGGGASQIILEIGKTYLIEFDYTAVSGSLKLDAIINPLDTTKKYSIVKTATQIPLTFYRRSGTAEGIIDNVSVKEIVGVAP